MYGNMVRIRKFESKAADAFAKGLCAGNIHLCIGQEATEVGACAALEDRDFITSTHRGHGHCISKGARTDKALAELFGKQTGYCGGKGGSMHIADVSLGILGANGIVGAGIPIATGSALASKIRGTDEVTLCFFGDGASNHGTFHESLNMAAAWKLPVVYLCENNGYGVSVAIGNVTNTADISVRAKAYDIPGVTVDGNDILAVYETVKAAVEHARAGNGPSLVECKTFRHLGHYCGDPASYRPDSYMEEAKKKDAIVRFRSLLLRSGVPEAELDAIDAAMEKEIEEAFEYSQSSPYPDLSTVTEDVYTTDNERSVAR
ncbi:thiamine pyrophosphate-dependent dehydrogenase E1 component subunit alpha [Desulfovibrio sp. OttesenSCG-928-C14]|nr:thiamine pyrophosphate-dependent dehydrogenase E1 component subunit alpha [Desulfovibrio sp. OttesenSCG-928-C14]